jgi:hypothetical protein
MGRIIPKKLTIPQLFKNFPAFKEPIRSLQHSQEPVDCLCAELSIQFTLPVHFFKFNLILSSHLRLGLPRGLLSSDLTTKKLYAPLLSPVHATYPAHIILLDLTCGYLVTSRYHEPPLYVTLSIRLLLPIA